MNPEFASISSREKNGCHQGVTGASSFENLTVGANNDTLPHSSNKGVTVEASSSLSSSCSSSTYTTRRKRPFVRRQQRRGGEAHLTLFKAAALASMSSPGGDESPEPENPGMATTTRRDFTHLLPMAPTIPEIGEFSDSDESCRKRIRGLPPSYLKVVEQTSNIFGDLCMAESSSVSKRLDGSSSKDEDINLCQATNQVDK